MEASSPVDSLPGPVPHADALGTGAGREHGVDPDLQATRLARSLLLDIVNADRARFEAARRTGRVLVEFVDEIDRAKAVYRRQPASQTPRSPEIFRRAIREILGASPSPGAPPRP
jgi:hypothetical protein